MIDVAVAKKLVRRLRPQLKTQVVSLSAALGQVLAQAIHAPIPLPPFDQSAMDGYAIKLGENPTYTLVGEVAAGSGSQPHLKAGEAVRIFTGAAVPEEADAVIQQEWVITTEAGLLFEKLPALGQNIRPKGEQLPKGGIALPAGQTLTPAALGLLASLGLTQVTTFVPPKVRVVVTGDELVEAGQALLHGQIYESNGLMLEAALRQTGFQDVQVLRIPDDYLQTVTTLQQQVQEADLLLVSGGISVGDYDHVGKALAAIGVEEWFYKVRQKPGKPLYMGTKDHCTVFALPGNPAAALSCYYEYVLTALRRAMGDQQFQLLHLQLPLTHAYERKGGRAQFLKAHCTGQAVTILDQQSSAMLQSFAQANALIYLPLEVTLLQEGDWVEVHLLPQL